MELTVQRAHHSLPYDQKRALEVEADEEHRSNTRNNTQGTILGTSRKNKMEETAMVSIPCSRVQEEEELDWMASNRPMEG